MLLRYFLVIGRTSLFVGLISLHLVLFLKLVFQSNKSVHIYINIYSYIFLLCRLHVCILPFNTCILCAFNLVTLKLCTNFYKAFHFKAQRLFEGETYFDLVVKENGTN